MFAMMGIAAFAADTAARIDVDGQKTQISLTPGQAPAGGSCTNAGWIKDEVKKKYILMAQSASLKSDDWEVIEFTFTPDKTGMVWVSLSGPWSKPEGADKNVPVWTCFDEIEVTGAAVKNGDFEQVDANGKPVGWYLQVPELFINENGQKYVKVWHNQRVGQNLNVTAGQEVKIKAKVKKAE